jgi:hypothetical protein
MTPRKRIALADAVSYCGVLSKARVAQLDRASASGAEGCGFDPRLAYQFHVTFASGLAPGLTFGFACLHAEREGTLWAIQRVNNGTEQ